MKNKFSMAVTLAVVLAMIITSLALADQVVNDIDTTVDSTLETRTITAGGSTIVGFYIKTENNIPAGDLNGCNATGVNPATVTLSIPAGVTASSSSLVFTGCGIFQYVTFSSSTVGTYTIAVASVTGGKSGSLWNTAPAAFTLVVNPLPNTPPTVTVTGVANGSSYEFGAVPAAGCYVTDTEDGNSSFAATLSAIAGPLSAYGLGDQTASCSYTDTGGLTDTDSATYSIVDTTAPIIDAHGDETAEATGPGGAIVSYTSPASHDAVFGDGVASCLPASGSLFGLGGATVTCNASDGAGNAALPVTFTVQVVDTTPPDFSCGSADSIWHADNQSVACTASDSGSGLATSASFSLSTDVAAGDETDNAYTNSLLVCDLAGNCVTAGPVGPFKIDRKAPSVSADPDRPADYNGWYNHALIITFTGTDGGSGGVTCDSPVNYGGPDNATASVSGSCADAVGNSASASFGFMYDATYPTAALSVTAGTPGANGWYTSNVTIHTSGTGSVSGVACTTDQFQTDETTGATFNGSCTSGAGLTTNADPLTVKLDKTGPTAVLSASGTLGLNGWYISDVTISTSGTDTISAPVTCTADQFQTTDTTGATFNGSCTNDAGLTTAASSLTVKRDTVAPTISASVSPARPASGWWNIGSGAPTVSFTCNDATSGVVTCPASHIFGQGENQAYSDTVYDNAGHSASAGVTDIDVDLTAPTLAWVGGPSAGGNYDFGFVPAAPTCTASDALSGPNGCAVTGYATTVGPHTMTATAYDVAGNSYSESRSYTVLAWILKGFYQPVDMNGVYNIVKSGSTVPLKFEIFRQVDGSEITDVSFVKSLMYAQTACNTTASADNIETIATGGTVLRYDFTAGQFIFNWKTPALAGKCLHVTMTTQDGSSLVAYFKLLK